MKSLWPEEFKEKDVKPVKEILEEQAQLLPKLTGDMVMAKVRPLRLSEKTLTIHHSRDFAYCFQLMGKFLKNYSFKVLNFSHEIIMYPTTIELDPPLSEELEIKNEIKVQNEEEMIGLLSKIFNSERLRDIVGSIIKISSEK